MIQPQGLLDIGQSCHACGHVDFLPFACSACGHVFCENHRARSTHACTARPVSSVPNNRLQATSPRPTAPSAKPPPAHPQPQPPPAAPAPASSSFIKTLLKTHVTSLAEKLPRPQSHAAQQRRALVQLKKTAVGDRAVAPNARVHVMVRRAPQQLQNELTGQVELRAAREKAVFVDRSWVVGRMVDYCCGLLDLPNRNSSGPTQRLVLFKNGHPLDHSVRVETVLVDGDHLVLAPP